MTVTFVRTLSLGTARQIRVVSALIIREVKLRNSKHAFMQLFDLMEAVVFIIVHWILFTLLHRSLVIGDSLLVFIATGIFPVLLFRTISIRVQSAMEAAKSVTTIPFIEAIDYAIARTIVEVISFSGVFVIFFALVYFFGMSRDALPYDITKIILFFLIIIPFSFGVGLINYFITYITPLWKFIWSFFSRVQIFFSAIFYIPEYMPPATKEVISYNPILHFVSLFRIGFYTTYPTHMFSMEYIVGWAFIVVVLGLALERALRNHRANRA